MKNYEELFWELDDIQEKYCFVRAWTAEVIFIEDDGFRFKDFTFENFCASIGMFNEESILDAFINTENEPLTVAKPGIYNFKALLSYSPEQVGEFGRTEIPSYLIVEHIDWDYLCTREEMEEQEREDTTPLLDKQLTDFFNLPSSENDLQTD